MDITWEGKEVPYINFDFQIKKKTEVPVTPAWEDWDFACHIS